MRITPDYSAEDGYAGAPIVYIELTKYILVKIGRNKRNSRSDRKHIQWL